MKPISFPGQNVVFGEGQPCYQPLPAYDDGHGRMVCCWQLTLRERLRVLFTGRIWHQVFHFHQLLQPQRLSVEKPDMQR